MTSTPSRADALGLFLGCIDKNKKFPIIKETATTTTYAPTDQKLIPKARAAILAMAGVQEAIDAAIAREVQNPVGGELLLAEVPLENAFFLQSKTYKSFPVTKVQFYLHLEEKGIVKVHWPVSKKAVKAQVKSPANQKHQRRTSPGSVKADRAPMTTDLQRALDESKIEAKRREAALQASIARKDRALNESRKQAKRQAARISKLERDLNGRQNVETVQAQLEQVKAGHKAMVSRMRANFAKRTDQLKERKKAAVESLKQKLDVSEAQKDQLHAQVERQEEQLEWILGENDDLARQRDQFLTNNPNLVEVWNQVYNQ